MNISRLFLPLWLKILVFITLNAHSSAWDTHDVQFSYLGEVTHIWLLLVILWSGGTLIAGVILIFDRRFRIYEISIFLKRLFEPLYIITQWFNIQSGYFDYLLMGLPVARVFFPIYDNHPTLKECSSFSQVICLRYK